MWDLFDYFYDPRFVVMVLSAVAAFATAYTLAIPLLGGNRLNTRMKYVSSERDYLRAERLRTLASERVSLQRKPKSFMMQVVEQFNVRKMLETDGMKAKLKQAGLRGQAPIVAFLFFRMVMPIITFFGALAYLFLVKDYELNTLSRFGAAFLAAFVGFYLPNLFIHNIIQKRQLSIKRAFPDALDLLLICVQSGMSIEAAFAKVAGEVGTASIELAEELSLTTAELSYLPDRRQAYDNLSKRTGLPGVKAVATSLVQSERYGTPVATALRVLAQESRDVRMAEAEKKAAALPPKLTVPMIMFFLPVLFIVILGPAAIQVMEVMAR